MKRGDLTEKKIIQASLYLFGRDGYHSITIDDITRRVGLTQGALYSHFSRKESGCYGLSTSIKFKRLTIILKTHMLKVNDIELITTSCSKF